MAFRVNITKTSAPSASVKSCSPQDENIVEVKLSVQYAINDPINFVLKVRDPERSLQDAAQSALRHVVGGASMDMC
ncbi:MAG: hypothetical protein R3E50_07495 [Halioglobus sp.]